MSTSAPHTGLSNRNYRQKNNDEAPGQHRGLDRISRAFRPVRKEFAPSTAFEASESQPSKHSEDAHPDGVYSVPDTYANLSEVAVCPPEENPDERALFRHQTLEDTREFQNMHQQEQKRLRPQAQRTEEFGRNTVEGDSGTSAESPATRIGLLCRQRCSIL